MGFDADVGAHCPEVIDDGLVGLAVGEVEAKERDLIGEECGGAEEEGCAGEIGGDWQVEGRVILAALDFEFSHAVVLVLYFLPVEPVECHLDVAGLVEERDVDIAIAGGEGGAEQQAGEVLAGGRGDGGRASGELSADFDGGPAVVVEAAATGSEVFECVEQRGDGAGEDLLVAGECCCSAGLGEGGRTHCDSQGRAGVADVYCFGGGGDLSGVA